MRVRARARVYLLLVLQHDGAVLLHHLKHHDPAEVPAHRHGHVGEGRELVHELQQLLCSRREPGWPREEGDTQTPTVTNQAFSKGSNRLN